MKRTGESPPVGRVDIAGGGEGAYDGRWPQPRYRLLQFHAEIREERVCYRLLRNVLLHM